MTRDSLAWLLAQLHSVDGNSQKNIFRLAIKVLKVGSGEPPSHEDGDLSKSFVKSGIMSEIYLRVINHQNLDGVSIVVQLLLPSRLPTTG